MGRPKHNAGFNKDSGRQATNREISIAVGQHRDAKHKRKQTRHARKRWFLRHVEIECELWRGTGRFGRKQNMTMKQMGLLNNKYIIQYGAALDTNPDAILWKWKIVDYSKFKQMKEKHMNE